MEVSIEELMSITLINTSRQWMLCNPITTQVFKKVSRDFVLCYRDTSDFPSTLLNRIVAWMDAYLRAQSLKHKLTTNQVMRYQQLHATRADFQKLYLVSI